MLEILSIYLDTHIQIDVHCSLRKVSCGISYVPSTTINTLCVLDTFDLPSNSVR